MRYPETVEYLYALGNEIKTVKFGLEAITLVLADMGNPQEGFRSVHIAGTNGKGSTCAMIESALRASGLRTGLYTSPHLIQPTERIRICGHHVTADRFAQAFARVHDVNERLLSEGKLEHHTTYFETVTAMAFLLFAEAKVDMAVLETGLGGRLDATNVVRPELTAITPIDFDHESWLGNSLEQIAAEKAGILKPDIPVILARQRPEAAQVVETRARELRCSVHRVADREVRCVRSDAWGSDISVDRLTMRCPLPGTHQVENAATAVTALQQMNVAPDHIAAGIAQTQWPARLQRIGLRPDIVLDGAHNPAGARALAEYIRTYFTGREVWLVYGAMRDKSVAEITEILFPLAQRVILTAVNSPRAIQPETLASTTDHPAVTTVSDSEQALRLARSAPSDAAVFITGSLYLAGEILRLLQ